MEFTMLEELEDIESPTTREFIEGFVAGMTTVGVGAGIVIGIT